MQTDATPPHRRFRTIFLSDFHMGAKSFDGAALASFLKHHDAEMIYLVGDIVDGWKLHKRWHWPEDCLRVLDELARKVFQGTRIVYISGNHDETIRFVSFLKKQRFAWRHGIKICNRHIHHTVDNKKLLVIHGDQFDRQILRGPLSRFGDCFYDDLIGLISPPHVKINGKTKRFSLAKALRASGKLALRLLNNFEAASVRLAKRTGADGIVCGHTHIPALKNIRGIIYANCGSWLCGTHTALAESHDGSLTLLDWVPTETDFMPSLELGIPALPAPDRRFRRVSDAITAAVRRTWPAKEQKSLSFLLRLFKVGSKTCKSGQVIQNNINRYRRHVVAEPALRLEFCAKA